jgi:DNA polymerase III epsilon subunit-like protein
MNARLIQSQKLLHDTLFDLYMVGGLESVTLACRGVKRELIIDLETSGLTPETGEIIRYRAVNRWDADDEFDEWAKPMAALTPEAERIVGVTNAQLAGCRPSGIVMEEFVAFFLR